MLIQLAMLGIMISLCMVEVIMVDSYFSTTFSARLNLVFAITIEMFIFSYRGEQIKHESHFIRDRIYNSEWYQLIYLAPRQKDMKELKSLILLTLMRANRPTKISAGRMTTMSYQTFMSVSCKCSERMLKYF